MTIRDIAKVLEAWAPPASAESYDNVGLLAGDPDQEVTGVLINLDATEAVVEEAVQKGCNLLIAHHPIWFGSRKRLTPEDYVGRTLLRAVRAGVGLYAIHTNLDNVRTGVNQRICERLGLTDTRFLHPKDAEAMYGSGMIGRLPAPMTKEAFLDLVKGAFYCGSIRYADAPTETIQTVAVCGGSGSFLIPAALQQGADAFVTADITYHKFFDNEDRLLLLDIGHYESEQFTSALIHAFLSEKFPNFAVRLSETHTNPVRYH
ncbi:MAG: Nif3-like dinuclear metal center hexameric protein [Bacteroidetes bacterium]|nr:MAG: Nif3-like dinuclear metal center hexameric protein [Bacteroidota bacterium]